MAVCLEGKQAACDQQVAGLPSGEGLCLQRLFVGITACHKGRMGCSPPNE